MKLPEFALSIRQPWAWLILHSGKDVENRTWQTKFRGRVLIHASKVITLRDINDGLISGAAFSTNWQPPALADLHRGGIVGSVEIVDCVQESESLWFSGPWGFVLRDSQPLPFQPCRGMLHFFHPKIGEVVA